MVILQGLINCQMFSKILKEVEERCLTLRKIIFLQKFPKFPQFEFDYRGIS